MSDTLMTIIGIVIISLVNILASNILFTDTGKLFVIFMLGSGINVYFSTYGNGRKK